MNTTRDIRRSSYSEQANAELRKRVGSFAGRSAGRGGTGVGDVDSPHDVGLRATRIRTIALRCSRWSLGARLVLDRQCRSADAAADQTHAVWTNASCALLHAATVGDAGGRPAPAADAHLARAVQSAS